MNGLGETENQEEDIVEHHRRVSRGGKNPNDLEREQSS